MRALVAEDDASLRRILHDGLVEAGYVVDTVPDGDEALRYIDILEYSVLILDWRMPGLSGREVLARVRVRDTSTPIVMLTARDAPEDRIDALDAGADDYVVKPFDFGELLARLRALQRRNSDARSPTLSCGALEVDPSTHRVHVEGREIRVTPREFAIVELLVRKSPGVVTRRSIALQAWPEEADAVGSNTIEVHIARLRSKLVGAGVRVETVRGVGYRLAAS
ncbi:MAG TPA: response regulator transcription factor [Acidimicrobiales bacterium]|jgi:DNA-binding response OmpR family regulator